MRSPSSPSADRRLRRFIVPLTSAKAWSEAVRNRAVQRLQEIPLWYRVALTLAACLLAGFLLAMFSAPFWVGMIVVMVLAFFGTPLVAL